MIGTILLYIGAFLIFGWGSVHLFPTKNIVRDFGDISADNKHILTMEWITEGVALMFIGILVALVTYIDHTCSVAAAVYWSTFAVLNVLSTVSIFTGFKHSFIVFKLCPFIFTVSSLLIIIGYLIR